MPPAATAGITHILKVLLLEDGVEEPSQGIVDAVGHLERKLRPENDRSASLRAIEMI